ncbi:MAG: hypothetical protein ACWA5P_14345 [bacterium]
MRTDIFKNITSFILLLLVANCTNEPITQIEEAACDNGTFVGSVTLTTQQEVDDFGAMCYTKINGALIIDDKDQDDDFITNLSPLENLTEIFTTSETVHGSLYVSTNELTNLEGLNNLTKVSRLVFYLNDSLENLNGLDGLIAIEGNNQTNSDYGLNELLIRLNPSLLNLNGLNNLQSIGTSGNVSLVSIRDNNLLQDINGLESLTTIGYPAFPYGEVFGSSPFIIYGNPQLQHLDGLASLSTIYGYLQLIDFNTGSFNESLTDFCGLQNLLNNGMYDDVILNEDYISTQDIIEGNCSQ